MYGIVCMYVCMCSYLFIYTMLDFVMYAYTHTYRHIHTFLTNGLRVLGWHADAYIHTYIHTSHSGLANGLRVLGWHADDLTGQGMEYVEVVLSNRYVCMYVCMYVCR
jgi:hypothetical protein